MLVQLAPFVLTVNELPPYPGWGQFVEDIRSAWENVATVTAPAGVERVGLRYINGLPRRDPEEPVSEWLAPAPWWPDAVREHAHGFRSRYQVKLPRGEALNVTVGEATPEGGLHRIILDVDVINEAGLPAAWEELAAEIERLHERAWEVFDAARTPRLLAALEGDAP